MQLLFLLLALASVSFAANPFLDSLVAYAELHAPDAKLGISVRSVQTDSIIYSHNGNEWFVPASTMKLLITAAALQKFPLNYAPKTIIHLEGIKKQNVFSGVLRIEGRGDPRGRLVVVCSFMARQNFKTTNAQLRQTHLFLGFG